MAGHARCHTDGIELEYSGHLIATGSETYRSPFPPMGCVYSLRTFADSGRFRGELAEAQRIVSSARASSAWKWRTSPPR
jgi:hypothetical protein